MLPIKTTKNQKPIQSLAHPSGCPNNGVHRQDVFDALFSIAQKYVANEDYGFDSEFPEGREIERKHRLRERNQAVIKSAKEAFKKKNGKLYCQVCGFDF